MFLISLLVKRPLALCVSVGHYMCMRVCAYLLCACPFPHTHPSCSGSISPCLIVQGNLSIFQQRQTWQWEKSTLLWWSWSITGKVKPNGRRLFTMSRYALFFLQVNSSILERPYFNRAVFTKIRNFKACSATHITKWTKCLFSRTVLISFISLEEQIYMYIVSKATYIWKKHLTFFKS